MSKINGTSEQSTGVYFDCQSTEIDFHFYEEIELIGVGIIGVEINLLPETSIDNLEITGTSVSNSFQTNGIKFSPSFNKLITKGNFESINGSIQLTKTLSVKSFSTLELNSDHEIFIDSGSADIEIQLGVGGVLDIINGYLNTTSKLRVSGTFFNEINIPNGGKIEGDALFEHNGITTIGNGLQVNGALQWTGDSSTGILCGEIVATPPFNTKTGCSTPNQLSITNTGNIDVFKVDGHETLTKPPVLISGSTLNLKNNVNNFSNIYISYIYMFF